MQQKPIGPYSETPGGKVDGQEDRLSRRAFLRMGASALGAVALTVGLQLSAVYMPGLKTVLRTAPLGGGDWLVVGACALAPLAIGQARRWLRQGESQPAATGV